MTSTVEIDIVPTKHQHTFATGDEAFFVGARQSGKTTAVLLRAARAAADGATVVVGSYMERMVKEMVDRIQKLVGDEQLGRTRMLEVELGDGVIYFRSFYDGIPKRMPSINPDVVVLDEAQELKAGVFEYLMADFDGDVAFAGTPKPGTVFNIYAKYGRFPWMNVPADANPEINEQYLEDYTQQMRDNSLPNEDRVGPHIHGEFPAGTNRR